MVNDNRLIKGVWIPIDIWDNETLNWTEKILLVQIDSYTSKETSCFFSNEYIAKLLKISVTQASRTISSLMKKGYIEQTGFDGRKRYIRSCIDTNVKADLTLMSRQGTHECQGSIDVNVNHTNILNNISNNIDNSKETISKDIAKKKVSLKSQQENLILELSEYKEKYSDAMLKEFKDYWTEPNQSKTKCRYKLQKTWDTGRRLATWARRQNNFNNSKADVGLIHQHVEEYKEW